MYTMGAPVVGDRAPAGWSADSDADRADDQAGWSPGLRERAWPSTAVPRPLSAVLDRPLPFLTFHYLFGPFTAFLDLSLPFWTFHYASNRAIPHPTLPLRVRVAASTS